MRVGVNCIFGKLEGKYRRGIMVCSECKITLCIKCYVPFHTVHDLYGNKISLSVMYDSEDEDGTPQPKRIFLDS